MAEVLKIGNRRWGIGVLLAVGVLVNYLDRISISVAAPQLQKELNLSNEQIGLLLSAFFWSYSLAQLPSGMLLDRFGVTRVGRVGAFLWTLASTLTALSTGYLGIFVARMLLGVAEAPGMISCQKATGYWFPRHERSRSTAVFDSAAKFANVIGVPLVAFFVVRFGWRWGFGITAMMSIAYFFAYWILYRDPSEDKKLGAAEHSYIMDGGAVKEGPSGIGQVNMLGYVLRNKKVWAHTIGYSAYGYSFYLFLTWLPGYMVQTLHMTILKSAAFTIIPWMCASLADLLIGGFVVDYFIAGGVDESKARKIFIIGGMVAGLAVFGISFTQDPFWALVWISIALSGISAAAPVASSVVSLISPRGGTATVGGFTNFVNNLMGVVAPITTGFIVGWTGSFSGAFLVAGIVLLVGILAYGFMLGRIEPIPDPDTLV
ncbi:MAG: MFS transporter [Alphaproteobacteria bacterium]|nr:MFS transporter [Alphaproteobacteria bacterium]